MRAFLVQTPVSTFRYNYATGNIVNGSWGQVLAALDFACSYVEIFDSSGRTLQFGTGAAAAEVAKPFHILPGGNAPMVLNLKKGDRLSVKPVDGNATSGELVMNFYG